MRRTTISRRQFVTGATAAAAALAGCTGSETADGDNPGGSNSGDGSDSESTATPSTTQETVTGESGSTPGNSPDPDCSRLIGNPVPYDASDTLFVFSFDYIDSWELADPLTGSGGRTQGITSPIVTVDGEQESAGIQVIQSTDVLSASEVDAEIASGTEGQYARFEVVGEQEFDGETVRVVGISDSDPSFYQMWLPYGPADQRQYYSLTINTLTSILRLNEDNESVTLCNDPVYTAAETVRESLRPNQDTIIEEV
ncbi:twin-arginine translocation signal domain-containing protein [Salinibaculum salinum]|uniref:twin-arginine translocation signal domain-containing protein n=1 Tax=Salinibaculum salinum TaxID=3131996 RepID=UPI0030EDEF52